MYSVDSSYYEVRPTSQHYASLILRLDTAIIPDFSGGIVTTFQDLLWDSSAFDFVLVSSILQSKNFCGDAHRRTVQVFAPSVTGVPRSCAHGLAKSSLFSPPAVLHLIISQIRDCTGLLISFLFVSIACASYDALKR